MGHPTYIYMYMSRGTSRVFSGCSVPAPPPPPNKFSTRFLENCPSGEGLRTTACLRTVVGGKQGLAPCKRLLLQQSLFCVSVEFNGVHKTVTKLR